MNEYKKPPLGASPSWYIIPKRIQDLTSGIFNFTQHDRIGKDKEVTKFMRLWATEIICHCDTLDMLQDEGKEKNE